MSTLSSTVIGGSGKHNRPKDSGPDPLLSNAAASSKRARHAVVANAAFAESPLLASSTTSPSSTALSSTAATADTEQSAASLKSAFQSFAASLPPACSDLLTVAIPQQILAMHAYLQRMPPFQHSVHVPGEERETEPVDPNTLPTADNDNDVADSTAALSVSSRSTPQPNTASVESASAHIPSRLPVVQPLTAPLSAHPQLADFLPFLHSTLSLLLVHLSTLKLNLQLLIPPSDDSNNFGVEIQSEALSHLTAYEDIAFAALERIVVYGSNRAKMLSKVVKWPGIADYRVSVRELDEGMWLDGKCVVMECRETWMAVHDLLKKNEERLNDPKDSRGGGGYRNMAM